MPTEISTAGFITIVSGLPRSGTSMAMRMLEVGGLAVLTDGQRQADDDNPLGYYEFEAVKKVRTNASWVPQAVGKAVKMIYSLLYHLPDAYQYRVLFMRRNLEEVLASQRVMLRRTNADDGVDDSAMEALFRAELARFDRWISGRPNFSRLDLTYDEVVNDPEGAASRIAQFLGADLDREAMVRVVEPSLYRQRQRGTSRE